MRMQKFRIFQTKKHGICNINDPPIEKAIFYLYEQKIAFLIWKFTLLAILMHGQFLHHTQISFCPNTLFFTAKQHAYQSYSSNFLV